MQATDFRVSVVIPTYNRAYLLPLTLDAVLAQTIPPAEIIVVDDGSTDDTASVLVRYAPRVRTLCIANSGDLAARNVGLRAASSPFIAFCDSDDLWRPEFLAAMSNVWQAEPATKFAFGNFVIVRGEQWEAQEKFSEAPAYFWDGMRRAATDVGIFDSPIFPRLLRFQPIFPSCLIVRRDAFLEVGGWDEGTSRLVGCDFATALRLAEHAPLGILERPFVGIRRHAGNFSGDVQAMNLGDSQVLEYVLASRPWVAPHAPAIRTSINSRRRNAFDIAFTRRDFAAVQAIYEQLPDADRSAAMRVKRLVAGLPGPIGGAVARGLLRAGTLRARASA